MHMRNPGPQVKAANYVLRYLFGTKDFVLTFSKPVHPSGWPLQHKLITSADAGINHLGAPGITGITVALNGGTMYAVSRCQTTTTVSKDSTEAEAKAYAHAS